jgi:hypothetical protein
VAGLGRPAEGQPDGREVDGDRVEDAVRLRRLDRLVEELLQREPERGRTARPTPEADRVLLPPDDVVGPDPPLLRAADVFDELERLPTRTMAITSTPAMAK